MRSVLWHVRKVRGHSLLTLWDKQAASESFHSLSDTQTLTSKHTHTVMFGRLFLFSKVDGGLAVGAVSDKRRDVKWQVDLWALTEQRSSANLSQKLYSLITSSVKSGWMTSNRWALSLRLKTASDPLYFTLSKRFQLFESLCSFSRVSFKS